MEKDLFTKHKKRNLSYMINFRKYPFKQYIPVAEQMLCLIEQTDRLDKRKEDVLRRVIIGDSLNQIADDMRVSRQRVYELELKALAKLYDMHSPLVSRFDEFRRAEFSSKVAMARALERTNRNRQRLEVKARRNGGQEEGPGKRKSMTKKEAREYYKENKEEILGDYHRDPAHMARRMMRDLKRIRIHTNHILKRIERTEAHIKRYFF